MAEIKQHEERNFRDRLNLPQDVNHGRSQTESLVADLLQNVGLIQGFPGKNRDFRPRDIRY